MKSDECRVAQFSVLIAPLPKDSLGLREVAVRWNNLKYRVIFTQVVS